jgi:hypothetical protein
LTVGIIRKVPYDNTAAFKNQTVEILSESLNENFSQAKKKLYPQKLTAQPSCRQLRGKIRRSTFFRKNSQFNVDLDLWVEKEKVENVLYVSSFRQIIFENSKKTKKKLFHEEFLRFFRTLKLLF